MQIQLYAPDSLAHIQDTFTAAIFWVVFNHIQTNEDCTIIVDQEVLCNKPEGKERDREMCWKLWDSTCFDATLSKLPAKKAG